MSQLFRHIMYGSDRSGTFVWRKIWPLNSINCLAQLLNIQADYSQTPIIDQNYYKGMNSVTVQRWIGTQLKELFCKFLKPIMDSNCGYLVYEEDDFMFDGTLLNEGKREYLEKKYGDLNLNSIPYYNRGRKAFEGQEVLLNIKEMLNAADFVTVTTDYLKDIYHDFYDVPYENMIAIPNLLPRYLFGDRYDIDLKMKLRSDNKAKPRIGIVSSLSHFNVDNTRIDKAGNAVHMERQQDGTEKWINSLRLEVKYEDTLKITDDFDDIHECVRSTVDDFQWVCFGYCPPLIQDLADAGKIEVHSGVPIMNYPSNLENLKLQAVVAPIKKTVFNYAKSFIKTMECAALGIPLFTTNCLPYNRVMDPSQMFDTADELKERLLKLKFIGSEGYKNIIERQWRWLNSPCNEGDFSLKNFWLEDNLDIHINLLMMRSKQLNISMSNFALQYDARKAEMSLHTIFSDNNIEILR